VTTAAGGTDFERFLEDVRAMAAALVEKGWAEKNAGNLSVNVSRFFPAVSEMVARTFIPRPFHEASLAGERFLITGTGVRFRDIAKDPSKGCAILQGAKDRNGFHVVWGAGAMGWAPTWEFPRHLMVHGLLKAAGGTDNTVLHTHPTALIAMTHLPSLPKGPAFCERLWGMIPEVKAYLPGGARFVPYAMPGSDALGEATLKELKSGARDRGVGDARGLGGRAGSLGGVRPSRGGRQGRVDLSRRESDRGRTPGAQRGPIEGDREEVSAPSREGMNYLDKSDLKQKRPTPTRGPAFSFAIPQG
jgi:rhamnulose-1-phosphate aldolase